MEPVSETVDRLFRNTVCLAPMVRAGTLPLRALCLAYGADAVWTEEIVDRRLASAMRLHNDMLGTTDFISPDGTTVILRVAPVERGRLVCQIGTPSSTSALEASLAVQRDVDAIDINMGCPKRFSVQGGMGAALLSKPEVTEDIIKTLKRNLSVPVTAKIRVLELPSYASTIEFARRLEACGVDAITVHARTPQQDPTRVPATWDAVRAVVEGVSVPVIANGDMYTRADIDECRASTKCAAVMIARGALSNPSIFSSELLPLYDVVKEYLNVTARWDGNFKNIKYTIMEMMCPRRHSPTKALTKRNVSFEGLGGPSFEQVTRVKSMEALYDMFGLVQLYRDTFDRYEPVRTSVSVNKKVGAPELASAVLHSCDETYFATAMEEDRTLKRKQHDYEDPPTETLTSETTFEKSESSEQLTDETNGHVAKLARSNAQEEKTESNAYR